MQFSCDDYPHSVRGNILLYKDDLEEFVNSLKCNNVKGISIAANNIKYNCEGKKCDWDNWEADHIVAWSKGGKTIVENGQVACPECNSSKNNT